MEYPADFDFGMNTNTAPFIQEKITKQQIEDKVREESLKFSLRVRLLSERVGSEAQLQELIGRAGLEYVQRVNELLFTK